MAVQLMGNQEYNHDNRRFAAPLPAIANQLHWSPRQQFQNDQLESVIFNSNPLGNTTLGKQHEKSVRGEVRHGLLGTQAESADWRFVAWRLWSGVESAVFQSQTATGPINYGTNELKRLDRFVLPHLSEGLAPAEKQAFVDTVIRHFAWLGLRGFSTPQHVDIARHCCNLLRFALPEALENSDPTYDFHRRLGLTLSQVVSQAANVPDDQHQLKQACYKIVTRILKLPLPLSELNCFDSLSEFYCAMRNSFAPYEEKLGPEFFLGTFQKEASQSAKNNELKLPNQPRFDEDCDSDSLISDSYAYDEDTEYESWRGDTLLPQGSRAFRRQQALRDALLTPSLVDALTRASNTLHTDFWVEQVLTIPFQDEMWVWCMRALEKVSTCEFEAATRKLIIAASQNRFAAASLVALAVLEQANYWQPSESFRDTVAMIAGSLRDDTRRSAALAVAQPTSEAVNVSVRVPLPKSYYSRRNMSRARTELQQALFPADLFF